ncbi:MAG: DUF2752 domain-containing protein [Pseudonocardiales bacterium]
MVAAGCCAVAAIADPTRPGSGLPLCPLRTLTGIDCPICGSTRMLHSLLHGDVAGAARYNVAALLMLPALMWFWLVWAAPKLRFRAPPAWHPSTRVLRLGLCLLLVFSVARNLPWAPFSALHV